MLRHFFRVIPIVGRLQEGARNMSQVDRDKAFDRAIDLVINQDRVTQQWTGRYIAIQTSLAVAAATLLSWKGPHLGFVAVILAVVIGSIAIVLAYAVTQIIKSNGGRTSDYKFICDAKLV